MKEVIGSYARYELEKKKLIKKVKLEKQLKELKNILSKQFIRSGVFALQKIPRFNIFYNAYPDKVIIKIEDRERMDDPIHEFLNSFVSPFYRFSGKGYIVAELRPFDYIRVKTKEIYQILKNFGKKWKYKEIIKDYVD